MLSYILHKLQVQKQKIYIERYKLNNKEKLYNFNEKFNYLHNGKCCKNVLDKVIKR